MGFRMKTVFAFFLSCLAAMTVVAAPHPAQAAGDTVRRSLSAEPDSLDPHKAGLKASWHVLADMYEGLTRFDAAGQPVPGAAERWEVSADGLTYTFHLRPDLHWSDGSALTAADFVAGFRRLFDPATASKSAFMLMVIKNAPDVLGARAVPAALGVAAQDARTLTIELSHPAPKLPVLLAAPFAAPAPAKQLASGWPQQVKAVSNGAFKLVSQTPGGAIELAKNAAYYGAGDIAAETVIYRPITDEGTALWWLRSGDLDIVSWFTAPQMRWLEGNMPAAVRTEPALYVTYLVFNVKAAPFDDVRLRRAASLAIDRDLITGKVLRMGDEPTDYFVPSGVSDYPREALPQADWSLDRRRQEARALLKSAGFGPDRPLRFTFRVRAGDDERRVAIALSQMWKSVGIEADIQTSDLKTHYGDIEQGQFQLADAGWSVFDAPELFLDLMRSDTGALNYGGYENEAFDTLLRQGLATADLKARHGLFAEAERLMLEDQAVAPLYFNVARYVVAPGVAGFAVNAADIHLSQYLRLNAE